MICLAVLLLCGSPAHAASAEDPVEALAEVQRRELDLEDIELPREAEQMLDGERLTPESGLRRLAAAAAEELREQLTGGLRFAASVFCVLLLSGFGTAAAPGGKEERVCCLAGAAALAVLAVGDYRSLGALGRETVASMSAFSKGLLFSLAAATGTMGLPTAASANYGFAMLACDLFLNLSERFFLPLIGVYLAAVIADAVLAEPVLSGVASFVKRLCSLSLTGLVTLMTALLAISGLVAGNADAVARKTAKLVISSAVPVVGGILSDAAESVIAAAQLVRGTAGLMGLFGVTAVCLGPFLRIGVRTLLFRMAGAAAAPAAPPGLCRLAEQLAGGFSLLCGVVGGCALMNLISVVSFMRLTGAW